MSIFGAVMFVITLGWTLFMLFIISILGDIYVFLRGAGVLTFIVGYVIIILVYVVLKRLARN